MVLVPRNKPPGRPKKPQEILDVTDLHMDWDSSCEIRERLLEGGSLLAQDRGGEDIPTCIANIAVLQPCVTRMSLTQSRPLPAIESLRESIEAVYLRNKRGKTQEDMPDVVGLGWRVRKLLGFVKMKVRRKEVSSVPCMQNYCFELPEPVLKL